ncbi:MULTISPECIES: hypothetical protein [unclassified Paracoccus (in: a-proteobacteria)]|uniref:hypothetical protein n=1 Tax=unclassified Paracoccus (in: a-proteobacteria) TaxID=2688777 RepID=UPI001601CAEB|nr:MULTISPECIES: hypothetical protein [unclassified Paracoccus (in: a-proteobacteria)]MBB1491469.1 hypothetical protein [Paracoccus sp. MC1854]MBB1497647.1 hypothetical protein [Paracoccus sp. MC1862]QQO44088.1 hypothetical protein JGR78_11855 [Paracoccus sp. MC1862]
MSWTALLAQARTGARLRHSPHHGEVHWRAVAATGLELARRDLRADPAICMAFAVLHDCRRVSEHRDPRHGPAAAGVAQSSETLLALLGSDRAALVAEACFHHEGGKPRRDQPLIGACFDADRFTLGRVGIEPEPRYFSVIHHDPAFAEMVRFAEDATDDPPGWEELFARLG